MKRTLCVLGALAGIAGCAPPHRHTTVVENRTSSAPPPAPNPVVERNVTTTQTTQTMSRAASSRRVAQSQVNDILRGWPTASRGAADDLIQRYGMPDEATSSMLSWSNNGEWKRTIVHRDLIDHNFPQPHQDCVEQVIDYQVPAEKLADLDRFDGSLSFSRTRGELTSWAQNEQDNRLAVRLADDLVNDRMTVDDARADMARAAALTVSGKSRTQKGLNINRGGRSTADPDSAVELNGGDEPSPQFP